MRPLPPLLRTLGERRDASVLGDRQPRERLIQLRDHDHPVPPKVVGELVVDLVQQQGEEGRLRRF